jgi:16S rRNA (guanine527-N7)-methyltransferase
VKQGASFVILESTAILGFHTKGSRFHVKQRMDDATVAARLFGDRLPLAEHFVALLTEHGVIRGLIGPREVDRLWDRHVLNSAVIAGLVPESATVIDVGSGAGLPGVPLAIARPDIEVTLLEPMARRVAWLTEVVDELGIDARVVRGRAEEPDVRRSLGGVDVVTARAVAPLAKLAGWCLPLAKPGGVVMALKGESANEELARDTDAIRRAGGVDQAVVTVGAELLPVPTTVVLIHRSASADRRDGQRRTRKDR